MKADQLTLVRKFRINNNNNSNNNNNKTTYNK